MIKIKRGLDLPLQGAPKQKTIETAPQARQIALLGPDYVGMKPTMHVAEGDRVKIGQPLFGDKKAPGVHYTAPAAGTINSIHRGAKRALLSVVIDVDEEVAGETPAETFEAFAPEQLCQLDAQAVERQLLNSGLWTALRTRPYSRVPTPGSAPHSIFVTAMDTNALAMDPHVLLAEQGEAFGHGLDVLARLTNGPVFVCTAPGAVISLGADPRVRQETFDGPHPAGLPGTHIHFLDPVGPAKNVWHIGYQDVIAIGKLFTTGRLWLERVVALAGPCVERPRLLRTRLGVSAEELCAGACSERDVRFVSGPVLSGHIARGALAFLGRYDLQVAVLREDREREFLHYLRPGGERLSVLPAFLGGWLRNRRFDVTTSANGSPRAMVPIGTYEAVMPLDILPTQLLRSLLVGDVDSAINLGCLELDEEDLGLCTFACPGKYEYGPILRDTLTRIEKEG